MNSDSPSRHPHHVGTDVPPPTSGEKRRHAAVERPTANSDAFREGDLAARELADALKLAGITLPSLRGDFPTVTDQPLVHLGGASATLVRQLAAWIRQRA